MAMENETHSEISEDALSFCDLLMDKDEKELDDFPTNFNETAASDSDFFEFEILPKTETATEDIVFFGKQIKQHIEFVRHPRNGLFIRRDSFKKSQSFRTDLSSKTVYDETRSGSFRSGRPKALPAIGKSPFGSSSSRKHKVIIGLVNPQPKMELSEIRKRQSRRSPAPMFGAGGEPAVPGDGIGKKSHWGLLRPLQCRTHFMNALTKASFGCLSHV